MNKLNDETLKLWLFHPAFNIVKNKQLFNRITLQCNTIDQKVKEENSFLKILNGKNKLINYFNLNSDSANEKILSIILRLLCIFVLTYAILIMIYETNSWAPFISIIFLIAIFIDMMLLILNLNENSGFL